MNPGSATDFFAFNPLPKIKGSGSSFDEGTSWWLAELSRLSYRREGYPKTPAKAHLRKINLLKSVKIQRNLLLTRKGIKCEFFEFSNPYDEKLGALIFRGSSGGRNWLTNLNTFPTIWSDWGNVHRGFKRAIELVWNHVENLLADIEYPFYCAGHSLGGALAILAAANAPKPPLAVYTFGAPRIGDDEFGERVKELNLFRVVNHRDIVPMLPPPLCILGLKHLGELHYFTSAGKKIVDPKPEVIGTEREKSDRKFNKGPKKHRWFDPPELFYDHSPINYVRHLEHQIEATRV